MNKKIVRILLCVAMVTLILSAFSMTAFAAGDVAGAIESTWNTAKDKYPEGLQPDAPYCGRYPPFGQRSRRGNYQHADLLR